MKRWDDQYRPNHLPLLDLAFLHYTRRKFGNPFCILAMPPFLDHVAQKNSKSYRILHEADKSGQKCQAGGIGGNYT